MSKYDSNRYLRLPRLENEDLTTVGESYLIKYGEPVFYEDTSGTHYLVVGQKQFSTESNVFDDSLEQIISNGAFIPATDKNKASYALYGDANGGINTSTSEYKLKKISPRKLTSLSDEKKYILLGSEPEDGVMDVEYYDLSTGRGVYFDANTGAFHGAGWQDYAELRPTKETGIKPGMVVCDDGNGYVCKSSEYLQPCGHIVSDTYGMIIGDEENAVPIAVAGKALVYVDDEVEMGSCLCTGADGIARVMSNFEIVNFPDRIIGIVCEIPTYDKWKDSIEVDGRVWVNIK